MEPAHFTTTILKMRTGKRLCVIRKKQSFTAKKAAEGSSANVLHAAMSLFDVMKPEEESSILNKDTTNARRAIGWINHLFHEEYALEDGKSIPPMKTADFLRLDDHTAYLFNPEALQGKRDYTMTDADRLY